MSNQTVTIECSTAGATIKYTTNGSDPVESSSIYTAPLTVASSETIKARAFKAPKIPSSITSAAYVISIVQTVESPTIVPSSGIYSNSQTITIECNTSGAEIRYTTDESTPTESSTLYSAPFIIAANQTIEAKAFKAGWTASSTASNTYSFLVSTPLITPAAGTYLNNQLITIECSTSGAGIRYTTDESTPTESSALYSGPFTVSTSQTIEAKAFKTGWTSSATASSSYIISLSISVIDSAGDVGKYSSIAVDGSNNPHVVYFDLDNKSIKYTALEGTSWQAPVTIDPSVGDDGGYCSMAIGSNEKVYISYFDSINGDLKYATNASGAWVITSVDTAGIVGKYSAITVDTGTNESLVRNAAHISYYDVTNAAIKYATNATGVWVVGTVAAAGTNYGHSSIKIDSRRKVHISYYNNTDDSLNYVTNMSSSWETKAVNSSPSDVGSEAGYNSIVLDTMDNPFVAYNGSLIYSCNAGVAWTSETIDSSVTTPLGMKYISMAREASQEGTNKLHISYFDGSDYNLKYASNSSGSWQVYTLDSTGVVGRFSSIAVDANNKFHISYYDDTNHQLKYATNK